VKKVPKLYSVRQVAKLVNRQAETIRQSIRTGRLIGAHWVDGRWIIQEDFRIKHHGIDSAGFDYLPSELISDEPEKRYGIDLPDRLPAKWEDRNVLKLPGFERVTADMTGREVRQQTSVHNITQRKIRKGEYVKAGVALRLAKGLGIDVEELLVK
jgi:hypothetical protein